MRLKFLFIFLIFMNINVRAAQIMSVPRAQILESLTAAEAGRRDIFISHNIYLNGYGYKVDIVFNNREVDESVNRYSLAASEDVLNHATLEEALNTLPEEISFKRRSRFNDIWDLIGGNQFIYKDDTGHYINGPLAMILDIPGKKFSSLSLLLNKLPSEPISESFLPTE